MNSGIILILHKGRTRFDKPKGEHKERKPVSGWKPWKPMEQGNRGNQKAGGGGGREKKEVKVWQK